ALVIGFESLEERGLVDDVGVCRDGERLRDLRSADDREVAVRMTGALRSSERRNQRVQSGGAGDSARAEHGRPQKSSAIGSLTCVPFGHEFPPVSRLLS